MNLQSNIRLFVIVVPNNFFSSLQCNFTIIEITKLISYFTTLRMSIITLSSTRHSTYIHIISVEAIKFCWRTAFLISKQTTTTTVTISECGKWNLSSSLAAKLAGETGDRFGTAGERWPSLAYLINTKDRTTCTASIIGPRWVVVAHSCITKRYVY